MARATDPDYRRQLGLGRPGDAMEANLREAAAIGWDAAVAAMRYEDGTPVEIVTMVNPYRPAPFTRYSGTAGSKVDAALGGDE